VAERRTETGYCIECERLVQQTPARKEYMRRYNKGRGVVLIGHSQGSAMLTRLIRREIEVGTFPGCVYAVGGPDGIELEGALGSAVVVGARIPMCLDTLFDAASLTKPLITTTLALLAVADGAIALDQPLGEVVEELQGTDKADITFRQLLTHSGGVEAWFPLYAEGSDRASYLRSIASRSLVYPSGSRVIYSDLGFILLHMALERIYVGAMADTAARRIFAPLSIEDALMNPPARDIPRIAATEWGQRVERGMCKDRGVTFDRFRENLIWGEVNDGNSWGFGGYAGNAGLFATARAGSADSAAATVAISAPVSANSTVTAVASTDIGPVGMKPP